MKQSDIMTGGEADEWLARNRDKLGQVDPVSDAIEAAGITPTSILEIGCSNGWRLAKLRDKYGCKVLGIEPGQMAAIEAGNWRVPVFRATAESLPVSNASYDLVIYGFCLYLTDMDDWFKIAAEGDRVLAPGGHLVIHDFYATGYFWRAYQHRDGLRAHHYAFERLWLCHPHYSLIARAVGDDESSVCILKKEFRI
jgi:SAM-dependent methyltransferase